MTPVFVDTSAWYASVARRDRDHKTARNFLETNRRSLLFTDYILDETVTLIQARLSHAEAVRFIDAVMLSPRVQMRYLEEVDVQDTVALFRRYQDKAWSFTDCASFVIMRRLGLDTAFAFDEHFRQAGFLLAQDTSL